MPQLSLHHQGVSVADLDRAIEFYHTVLGFDMIEQYTLSDNGLATAIGIESVVGNFAHFDAGTARIELVEYGTDSDGSIAREVYDAGVKHLGLRADNIDQVYEDLPNEIETISEPQTTGSGTRIFFMRDPSGNLIEVLEP